MGQTSELSVCYYCFLIMDSEELLFGMLLDTIETETGHATRCTHVMNTLSATMKAGSNDWAQRAPVWARRAPETLKQFGHDIGHKGLQMRHAGCAEWHVRVWFVSIGANVLELIQYYKP